jgi:hypothetical protein
MTPEQEEVATVIARAELYAKGLTDEDIEAGTLLILTIANRWRLPHPTLPRPTTVREGAINLASIAVDTMIQAGWRPPRKERTDE